uniref:FERM, ARHGEF and pleckstrin domain-containing protein 1 n=1 Tax=Callorhinchus milii TaxID=7868 RepID=A0A4W3GTZ6_CALMI
MGDVELAPHSLQTPGARLGVQDSMGISTLEPGQKPPSSPPGKLTPIKVQLLDEAQEVAPGKFLLDLICQNLNLVESDYFALEFLDHRKVMVCAINYYHIVLSRPKHVVMRFVVKFFPPDHAQLQEELTRYLFALQIKQDLASGRMICNEMSMALLVSHIIQSEIGDFDESLDQEHLEKNKYMPQQDTLEDKIMEFHRRHVGQTPAESDFQLLEIARRLETYGIRQHPAKDREGTKIHLSVSHTGIIVFQGQNKINSFNWAKVRKLSFKRKRFLIKFRPEVNSCQDTLEFSMNNRDSCKAFWKICVEYHAFFRLIEEPKPKPKPILFSRGSSFRFSGRTQKQLLDYRFPADKAYFIAKEVSTTERTYLKDLEVITVCFQNTVAKDEVMPEPLKTVLFSNFDPLYKFHTGFLKEIEQRLALCPSCCAPLFCFKQLTVHLQKHNEILMELEKAIRNSRKLEALCRDFEQQKVCYLPLNMFFLRPLHRLMHYKQILERLCKHYPASHADFRDSRAALAEVAEMAAQLHGPMIKMENFQKLVELKRDLIGNDNLVIPGREFIRQGCLSKLSVKGLQQRMFFLFNDILLYTSRGLTTSNQFKVHGQISLYGMTIEESEDEWSVPHCFTLSGHRQSIVVAASARVEMDKWIEDLQMAIDLAQQCNGTATELMTNKSSDETSVEQESEDDLSASRTSLERHSPHRGNTTMHVCWHRNTSVSMVDYSIAVENQLSGNLLRKFKNSNGWQKLWVVFTNFCLFFYKSHQDNHPLASLPLLGYSVTIPAESDNIHKDYVFKLQFKSHVYFFRAESEYTFERLTHVQWYLGRTLESTHHT